MNIDFNKLAPYKTYEQLNYNNKLQKPFFSMVCLFLRRFLCLEVRELHSLYINICG